MVEQKKIRLDYSDGVNSHLPDNRSKSAPTGSSFDYYRILSEDDPKHVRWMKTLGATLKAETALKDDKTEYTLLDFPDGYTLLEHNKSQGEGKKPRTDAYLFGHPLGGRFRSTNEFVPHLLWLAKDVNHNRANCACKLCAGGSGGGSGAGRTRTPRAKPVFTGMSEMGKAQMEKANEEMVRDLGPHAPTYRVGEVVLHKDRPCMVAGVIQDTAATDLLDTPSPHTYTLFDMEAPHQRLEGIALDEITPYLSIPTDKGNTPSVTQGASPVAKYNVQPTAHTSAGLPGPCYVAWFLGPEKIYHKDLVRLSSSGDPSQELLLLSHIILEVSSKTVKARGDIFQFVEPGTGSDTEETREIPESLVAIATTRGKVAKYVNAPGLEYDIPLADVHGRYYHSSTYGGELFQNQGINVTRGRVSSLPADLVSLVSDLFQENEQHDELTLGTRAEIPKVQLIQNGSNEPAEQASLGTDSNLIDQPPIPLLDEPTTTEQPDFTMEESTTEVVEPVVESVAEPVEDPVTDPAAESTRSLQEPIVPGVDKIATPLPQIVTEPEMPKEPSKPSPVAMNNLPEPIEPPAVLQMQDDPFTVPAPEFEKQDDLITAPTNVTDALENRMEGGSNKRPAEDMLEGPISKVQVQ